MAKYLIFNADDFGASKGVNKGIIECHTQGVLTSTSLMVTGKALDEAIYLSREHPKLAIGLHWDVWGEDERVFDTTNLPAVKEEFQRQLDIFCKVMGRMPSHIDSHRHAHHHPHVMDFFRELVAPHGIPLRHSGEVNFVGGFYAQWEWNVTNLEYVSLPFLQRMIKEEVPEGWTEFSCHPGYESPDYTAVYLKERAEEIQTLTHPAIRETIEKEGIQLKSFADYNQMKSTPS